MDELIKQMGQSGSVLLFIIPSLLQVLKKIPIIPKIQESFPLYQVGAIALGIGGAFALNMPVPIINGIILGFAACKGYDYVKGEDEQDK